MCVLFNFFSEAFWVNACIHTVKEGVIYPFLTRVVGLLFLFYENHMYNDFVSFV
jgi:hypothetical protein